MDLGQGVGTACGNLWRPVATESVPLKERLQSSHARILEAWRLGGQDSRLGGLEARIGWE